MKSHHKEDNSSSCLVLMIFPSFLNSLTMSEIAARRYKSKVSLEQLKLLIDFLSQHEELAAGTYRTMEARYQSKLLWAEAAKLLNGYKGGIRRPANGWSKYWSDFKIKLKNKLLEIKRKEIGVIKKEISPMTKLEKRALYILGPNFGKKYIKDGFKDPLDDSLPTEIKQESVSLTNEYCRAVSESDASSESDSNNSPLQSDGEVEEQISEAPAQSNIYPQWLIDVEKKRAEAELRRAKAEELRAKVSVKNAEAAFIQSQALRKLSDAADRQADAILRIAMTLESKHSAREDILII